MSQGLLNISIKRLGLLAISILFYSNFVADIRECYSDILLWYDPYYQLKCFGFHQFGKKGTFSVYFLPLFSIRWRILSNCILLKVTSSPQAGNFLGLGLREVVLCTWLSEIWRISWNIYQKDLLVCPHLFMIRKIPVTS